MTLRRFAHARLGAASILALALAGVWSASTASARVTTLGLAGWQIQSSRQAPQSGSAISQPGFATVSWLHIHPDDAGAAGTEVAALVQAGRCPSVFFAMNMKSCFGYLAQRGPDTIPPNRSVDFPHPDSPAIPRNSPG